MNVTELAHWRYRVKALERDLAEQYKKIDSYRYFWSAELGETIGKHTNYIRWLLEEARYKIELGELSGDQS